MNDQDKELLKNTQVEFNSTALEVFSAYKLLSKSYELDPNNLDKLEAVESYRGVLQQIQASDKVLDKIIGDEWHKFANLKKIDIN